MLVKAEAIGLDEYLLAQATLRSAQEAHDEFMTASGFDALLTPSAPGEAPSIETTGDSVFNRVWTSLGVPTVHLPVTSGPSGLPLGIQLVGQRWSDQRLLTSAGLAESSFGHAL